MFILQQQQLVQPATCLGTTSHTTSNSTDLKVSMLSTIMKNFPILYANGRCKGRFLFQLMEDLTHLHCASTSPNPPVIYDTILQRSNTLRNWQCGKIQHIDNRGDSPISRTLSRLNASRVRQALAQRTHGSVAKDNSTLSTSSSPLHPARVTMAVHCSRANCNTRSYPPPPIWHTSITHKAKGNSRLWHRSCSWNNPCLLKHQLLARAPQAPFVNKMILGSQQTEVKSHKQNENVKPDDPFL